MITVYGRATSSNVQAVMWGIGHVLFRYFDIDIPRRDRPGIAAYYDRLRARPAFREHVMVSYEPLRAEGAG